MHPLRPVSAFFFEKIPKSQVWKFDSGDSVRNNIYHNFGTDREHKTPMFGCEIDNRYYVTFDVNTVLANATTFYIFEIQDLLTHFKDLCLSDTLSPNFYVFSTEIIMLFDYDDSVLVLLFNQISELLEQGSSKASDQIIEFFYNKYCVYGSTNQVNVDVSKNRDEMLRAIKSKKNRKESSDERVFKKFVKDDIGAIDLADYDLFGKMQKIESTVFVYMHDIHANIKDCVLDIKCDSTIPLVCARNDPDVIDIIKLVKLRDFPSHKLSLLEKKENGKTVVLEGMHLLYLEIVLKTLKNTDMISYIKFDKNTSLYSKYVPVAIHKNYFEFVHDYASRESKESIIANIMHRARISHDFFVQESHISIEYKVAFLIHNEVFVNLVHCVSGHSILANTIWCSEETRLMSAGEYKFQVQYKNVAFCFQLSELPSVETYSVCLQNVKDSAISVFTVNNIQHNHDIKIIEEYFVLLTNYYFLHFRDLVEELYTIAPLERTKSYYDKNLSQEVHLKNLFKLPGLIRYGTNNKIECCQHIENRTFFKYATLLPSKKLYSIHKTDSGWFAKELPLDYVYSDKDQLIVCEKTKFPLYSGTNKIFKDDRYPVFKQANSASNKIQDERHIKKTTSLFLQPYNIGFILSLVSFFGYDFMKHYRIGVVNSCCVEILKLVTNKKLDVVRWRQTAEPNFALVAQENFDLGPAQVEQMFRDTTYPLDCARFIRLLEQMFEINILLITKKQNKTTDQYEHVVHCYDKTKYIWYPEYEDNKTVIILQNHTIVDKNYYCVPYEYLHVSKVDIKNFNQISLEERVLTGDLANMYLDTRLAYFDYCLYEQPVYSTPPDFQLLHPVLGICEFVGFLYEKQIVWKQVYDRPRNVCVKKFKNSECASLASVLRFVQKEHESDKIVYNKIVYDVTKNLVIGIRVDNLYYMCRAEPVQEMHQPRENMQMYDRKIKTGESYFVQYCNNIEFTILILETFRKSMLTYDAFVQTTVTIVDEPVPTTSHYYYLTSMQDASKYKLVVDGRFCVTQSQLAKLEHLLQGNCIQKLKMLYSERYHHDLPNQTVFYTYEQYNLWKNSKSF